jgi:glutamate--cysteine ligase
LERRLARLKGLGPMLRRSLKGIERECLRVTPAGEIAQTPHPAGLGSALTHPYITTDYSEALLELRTPPGPDIQETLGLLEELHRFVYSQIGDELLWAASMPCRIEGDESIPIARYGSSNIGKMKHIYRRGLGYRYGRAMQAIAGVHFNYSLPEEFWPLYRDLEGNRRPLREFIAGEYFALIRNVLRRGWMIPYLFGASPAFSGSFPAAARGCFQRLDPDTYYSPDATSLRMSDIGYKNKTQACLEISYNSLDEYIAGLSRAIATPHPDYERIGTKVGGEYRQLNTHILQIENEYYSSIRPKQIARSGERPTLALLRRGVQYVEVRALDVQPFEPVGVDVHQLRFLEAFLLLCLFEDSPPMDGEERHETESNHSRAACCGREPGLELSRHGEPRPLSEWALALCERLAPIAEILDEGLGLGIYAQALARQCDAIRAPETLLPSAHLLGEMGEPGRSFIDLSLNLSRRHKQSLSEPELPAERRRALKQIAEQSLARQSELEATDELPFDEYLRRYFSQS